MPAAPVADPGTRPMTPGVRAGLVAIASVIFWLGLSLFVFPSETATLFAWTIQPPLTAAFLGASYWASTTLAATCALERDWVRGRAFAAPYLIAGVVLLVVTLVYIDRFHMDAVTGWAWLVLYAIFPPAVVLLLTRQIRTPLTGRAIGTFVLAQGALALTVCREHDWGRVRPPMYQAVVLGVLQLGAILRFSDTLDWDTPGAWIYLGAVLAVLAVGVTGSLRCRRAFRT